MTGQKFKKTQNIGDKIFLIGCMLMALLLPLHKVATTIALILIMLGTVLGSKNSISQIPKRYVYLFFIATVMYGILVPGYFISEFKVYALDDLRIKLPMILLPLCFSLKTELKESSLNKVINIYIASSAFMSVLILLNFIYHLFSSHALIMNNELLDFTVHHPTYVSVYIVFAGYLLIQKKIKAQFKSAYLFIGILLLFIVAIVLLSSRLGIIMLFALLFGLALSYFKGLKKLLFISGVSIALVLIVYKVDFIRERFDKMINSFTMPATAVRTYEVDDRAMIWKNSISLIKKNPWKGYGTGDYKEEDLRLKHDLSGFGKGYRMHYNAHNQFLENWLATGITGFAILIIFYVYNFSLAFKKDNKTLFFFVFGVLVFSMIESIMQSQSGNMFLFFFTPLFYNKLFFNK